ncbi:MAG: tetratricopeptide repeat protein [Gammaproteobacteria bacterium]|nr:tetratricopeptide repeat protein [Gammaproteobacteria bacterium]
MGTECLTRKLAAILYADVAGYSRMMGEDEEGTHLRLREYLDEFSDLIQSHNGNVVKYAGDAALAEFATVTEAMTCAAQVQQALAVKNKDLPDKRKVEFRIGINLGEVIVDRKDIYGDGVNVAARLESLAQPGGICISESVYTAMGKKLDLAYEFMGEQQVKNIEQPVRAYRVLLESEQLQQATQAQTTASTLADKPSIAVLPFSNMSADPEQEYFADGMTEDIITALSHLSALTVIARNSSFAYKGKSVKVQDIARDLGVRYVLEGSVRKSGERARITAQLIDAASGHHLWAERYDRDLEDIFEIQDEITRNIAIALQVHLSSGEHAQIWQGGTRNFEAWQYQMRGLQAFYKSTREGRSEAAEYFEKAVAIDPGYFSAWAALGHTYCNFARYGDTSEPTASLRQSEEIAEKLLEQDETEAHGHALLAHIRLTQRRHEEAAVACAKAVELAPNNPNHRGLLAAILAYSQPGKALQHVNLAIQLSPHYPNWFTSTIFLAHYLQGDFDMARQAAEEAIAQFPDYPHAYVNLAAIYSVLGLDSQAREIAEKFLRMQPAFSLNEYAKSLVFQDSKDAETWVEHLRKVGLPE